MEDNEGDNGDDDKEYPKEDGVDDEDGDDIFQEEGDEDEEGDDDKDDNDVSLEKESKNNAN